MIEFSNVSFSYDETEATRAALSGVNFSARSGEFVAVVGRNGSGKSTLARHISALLVPAEGTVHVNSMDTLDENLLWEIRKTAAMVFQNPDNQMVATTVEEDVAFGPENLGIPTAEIRDRVLRALAAVGMSDYAKHAPHLLSGGQKQRVAIAGAFAMQPKILVLDEPTAMLDPSGRREIMQTLHKLNLSGMTIVLVTHFMEEAAKAQRVIVMSEGTIKHDAPPKELFRKTDELHTLGLRAPDTCVMAHTLRKHGINIASDVITPRELEADPALITAAEQFRPAPTPPPANNATDEEEPPAIQIHDLTHTYARGTAFEKTAVRNISLTIREGEMVGLIGHTGSGKSTLISHLPALLVPTQGEIHIFGEDIFPPKKTKRKPLPAPHRAVGLVFQYPEHQLFESTVWRDVAFGPSQSGVTGEALSAAVCEALTAVGLDEEIWQKSPFALSGGQKRRAAIAGILAMQPRILVLDEPTAGLDPEGSDEILRLIKSLHKNGLTIILVSHSMDALAPLCSRILVMNDALLLADDTPVNIFRERQMLEEIGLTVPQTTQILHILAKRNSLISQIAQAGIFTPQEAANRLAAGIPPEPTP